MVLSLCLNDIHIAPWLISNCAHILYEIPAVLNMGMLSVFTSEFPSFSCWRGSMTERRSAKTEFSEVQLGGYHGALANPGQFDSLVTHNAISKMSE